MTIEWWFAYLLTSIILSLSPGSGAINTMTTSINHGYRGAAASIAGLQTGLAIHIVLVGVGLGTLFSRSVLAFEVLKWAGAAYLIWLGAKMILTARHPLNAPPLIAPSGWTAAKKGYVVSMTNPKAVAFYGSIFALMVPAHAPAWFHVAVIAIAVAVSSAWYCGMALLASHPAVHRLLMRRKAVLDSVVGGLLIVLGGRMLAAR